MYGWIVRTAIRDSENVKDPAVRERYGMLSGIFGIILNLVLSAGKFAAGFLTSSVSIFADAFNSLSDAASSLAQMLGFRIAALKADKRHPFGHGRFEYLTGLAVSVVIMIVGIELGRTALQKIFHPEEIAFSPVSVAILFVSVAVKFWMFGFNRYLGGRIHSSAILASAKDSLSDCAATGAVLVGLLFQHITGESIDGWAGLLVAVLILRAGWESVKDTVSPLLGQAPDPELVKGIYDTVLAHREIGGIHDLVVHDYGPGHVMVTLHAEVDAEGDIRKIHEVIDHVERDLAERYLIQATIHMDPVITHDAGTIRLAAHLCELARIIDPGITLHDFRMTDGVTHMNLIFDLLVPRDCEVPDEKICTDMAAMIHELDPKYKAVIQIDHPY